MSSINTTGRPTTLTWLAAGRVALAAASLAAPGALARLAGARSTPEQRYLTRVYGIRALAIGAGFLTAGARERARWHRFGVMIDISDTVTGLAHAARGDVPRRASALLVAVTGGYAVLGVAELLRGQTVTTEVTG